MISSWIHAGPSNHIHYYHRRLHHQVSLPELQLWLNLAILPKLYSNSESSPEFACTLQNHPCQTIMNSFFFQFVCYLQPSNIARIANAVQCHSQSLDHYDCHESSSQLIVWNIAQEIKHVLSHLSFVEIFTECLFQCLVCACGGPGYLGLLGDFPQRLFG